MDGQDDSEYDSYSSSEGISSSEDSLPPIIVAKKPSTQISSTSAPSTATRSSPAAPSQSKPSIQSSINPFFSLSSMTKPISLQKHKTASLTSLHSLSSLTSLSHPKKPSNIVTPPIEKKHDEVKKPAKDAKFSSRFSQEVEDSLKRVQEFVSKKENEMLKNQFVEESTSSIILSRFKTFSFDRMLIIESDTAKPSGR